jgi:hypothetical protein
MATDAQRRAAINLKVEQAWASRDRDMMDSALRATELFGMTQGIDQAKQHLLEAMPELAALTRND